MLAPETADTGIASDKSDAAEIDKAIGNRTNSVATGDGSDVARDTVPLGMKMAHPHRMRHRKETHPERIQLTRTQLMQSTRPLPQSAPRTIHPLQD